jgi:hypothetical protein
MVGGLDPLRPRGNMQHLSGIVFALLLFGATDIPGADRLRPPARPTVDTIPAGAEVALFPGGEGAEQAPGTEAQTTGAAPKASNGPLQEQSKLSLIRYVSGEFAKARTSLPAGKQGFEVAVGKPIDRTELDRAVATRGAAIHGGDSVQITRLDFRSHVIAVDINGGGRGKKSWKDRLQISMGGVPTMRTTTADNGPPGFQPGMGSTLLLDFSKDLPDMTPDDLKALLAPFLDFSKERSASVHWFDTLPPEMKAAIKERRAAVGMDREMVVAAVGKPERKVRERDLDGNDTEDWIYGNPPDKTIFVHFTGERVTRIEEFPR